MTATSPDRDLSPAASHGRATGILHVLRGPLLLLAAPVGGVLILWTVFGLAPGIGRAVLIGFVLLSLPLLILLHAEWRRRPGGPRDPHPPNRDGR